MTAYTESDEMIAARLRHRRRYVRWVEDICRTDPGARAALRRGLRRGIDDTAHVGGMHRLVTPWLPEAGTTSDAEQRAYYTVAALIAAQPRHRLTGQDGPAGQAARDGVDPDPLAPGAGQPCARDADGECRRPPESSLGAAFAHAVAKGPGRERELRQSAAERRLNLLTRQSPDGLHRHLPAAVLYLGDREAPLDWAWLMTDLIDWPVRSGAVSRRWLQDFYQLCAAADRDAAARADRSEARGPDGPE